MCKLFILRIVTWSYLISKDYHYHYYYFTAWKFFSSAIADGFTLEFELQQVFSGHRTLLSILADLNNTVVWRVSSRPVICKSFSLCNNPLVTVPKVSLTIGIIITFMFHGFFNSQARSRYLSLFSHSFNFTLWSAGIAKSTLLLVLSFLLIIIRSGHLP